MGVGMQLRDMRYATIEGTEVAVKVASPVEAKSAIKELRHKKKEIDLLKKRLAKELTRARARAEKAEREAERKRRQTGLFAMLRRVSTAFRSSKVGEDVPKLESDLERLEEIALNVDSCIIQLEGKLLN
ncbi:MAG: hypothetical protein NW216_12635 [Hyphomicrobium sp.]|nr:hypothetical protein [Hyphomicrobium sp.]